jgi:hypothetical protein
MKSESERKPLVAAVLASQFLELIQESGVTFGEATAALKAAHALVQTLPLRISYPRADDTSDEESP